MFKNKLFISSIFFLVIVTNSYGFHFVTENLKNKIFIQKNIKSNHQGLYKSKYPNNRSIKILAYNDLNNYNKLQFDSILQKNNSFLDYLIQVNPSVKVWLAKELPFVGSNFIKNLNGLSVNKSKNTEAKISAFFPFVTNNYDIIFCGSGENIGSSTYSIFINDKLVGEYSPPLSNKPLEEGNTYNKLFENIIIENGAKFTITAKVGSADGNLNSKGFWSGIAFTPKGKGLEVVDKCKLFESKSSEKQSTSTAANKSSTKDGLGEISITGELKQWHKVTLNLAGPFAKETDRSPNPYSDYRMNVIFRHESGSPIYNVPAYFAADGNAAETSATEGNIWRAHLSPDKVGKWFYKITFLKGALAAIADMPWTKIVAPYDGLEGTFNINPTDKVGNDFRAKGRLQYVGKNHLQFSGSREFFFKTGSDSPETLLAFDDFDNTIGLKPKVPLKKYIPHLQDYMEGNPTWKNGKGKGLIGAINYLSNIGINAISFLTYNAGGDGNNVWPFILRNEKMNYDCSKLDQWQIIFDYAQSKGLYLHFKTQETENDDHRFEFKRIPKLIPDALDAGELGPERMLYYRELISRFGYLLALNWNLGEENTQTSDVHQSMADYFFENDPYKHHIVLHTYPQEQNRVYLPLLGKNSQLTGPSLQNEWDNVFKQTLKWINESNASGKPWVVANDEQGGAGTGVVPDTGYKGFNPSDVKYDMNDIRKQTLWGNLMAGGAGVEYYFGYKLAENDLIAEDFRSRDKSWDYCKIALDFLKENKIPFQNMSNKDALIENFEMNKDKHCLAKEGEVYLISLAYVPTTNLNLTNVIGNFSVDWFNPVTGGKLQKGNVRAVKGGKVVNIGKAPTSENHDWVVLIRKN